MILALGRAHNATSPDFSKEISLAFNTLFDRCHHHQIIKFNKLRFKFNFKFNQRTRVISAKSFDQLTHFAKGILSLWLFLILAVLSTPEIFDGFFLFVFTLLCVCLLFMRRVDHTSPFPTQQLIAFRIANCRRRLKPSMHNCSDATADASKHNPITAKVSYCKDGDFRFRICRCHRRCPVVSCTVDRPLCSFNSRFSFKIELFHSEFISLLFFLRLLLARIEVSSLPCRMRFCD